MDGLWLQHKKRPNQLTGPFLFQNINLALDFSELMAKTGAFLAVFQWFSK
jgi:hypothetical protein